ncbi:MAG: DUF4142 domain-containing protein [Alphaproteobacteria bacterium]|nr:DUF4142 domain-containing protein [Alphaproteobacteria bacterium]
MIRVLTAASVAALLALPAAAQTQYPATTPGTGPGAPAVTAQQPNQADRDFIQQATIAGLAEVELGQTAEQKAQSPAVKEFARRMVVDHTKANNQLAPLAKAAGVTQPMQLDAEHSAMKSSLQNLSGAAFDQSYIQGMVQDHEKVIQLFQHEASAGQDAALKGFATETLPILQQHLQMAQSISSQLAPQAGNPRGTSGMGSSSGPSGSGTGR